MSRDRVRPATPLEDLVPRSGRRKGWRALKRAFGVGLPGLRRPKPLGRLVASAWWASALVALAAWMIGFQSVPAESAVVGVIAAAVSAQVGALLVTRPLSVEFAPGCLTVRHLVGSLVDARRERSLPVGRAWDRETVWVALITVVSEVAGVERGMLTERTSFVYDLGMD